MKIVRMACVLLGLSVTTGLALTVPRPLGTTVLVVPARYSVLQVAFDVSDRMGAVLLAYQGDAKSQAPIIDFWAGQEWKRLSLDEYRQASFAGGRVSRFFIVGTEEILPPILVSSVSDWCGDVRVITSLDTPGLVNAFGKAFDFAPSEWEWFARRYNLQLADRNAERRSQSWYDRDYYDDEWAHRWQWLRRKYNPPAESWLPTRSSESVSSIAIQPAQNVPAQAAVIPETASEVESAAPAGEVERRDVPVVQPLDAAAAIENADMGATSDNEELLEENQAPEPEEEPWPVK